MNIHNESIANLTKVSMTIAKYLFSKQKYQEKNVVISPLSLHIVRIEHHRGWFRGSHTTTAYVLSSI
jgi:hypothetical protein